MPEFLFTPAPHTEAAKFIATKRPVSRGVFDGLLPELRGRAFTVKGVEDANVLAAVRDRIARLPLGGDWAKLKHEVAADLSPWLEPERATKRAELLMRVHGYAAYSAAQYQVMDRQRDVFPFWQYQSSDDGKVRPSHAALEGKVLPADSPFWQDHFPPWEFGCRCQVVPLSEDDVAEIQQADAKKVPEARRVLSPDDRRALETTGRLITAGRGGMPEFVDVRSPRARQGGSGFHHFPGDLSLSLEDLRARYRDDPQTWATFESWSQATRLDRRGTTVFDWLSGRKPDGTRPTLRKPVARAVPAVPPPAPVVPSRSVDAIIADLERVAAETEREIAAAEAAVRAVGAPPTESAGLQAWFDRGNAASRALRAARERRLALVREAVSVPVGERGRVGVRGIVPHAVRGRVPEGAAIVEALVHPALLPSVEVHSLRTSRAFYRHADQSIHINRNTSPSTIAHEIGHAVELGTPEIERGSRAFLQRRAGGAAPKSLRALTGQPYRADEVAYEDEWVARGGNAYTGKLYPRATEVVSMGIERLWDDPLAFARRDPDYFRTLVSLLQKLP